MATTMAFCADPERPGPRGDRRLCGVTESRARERTPILRREGEGVRRVGDRFLEGFGGSVNARDVRNETP